MPLRRKTTCEALRPVPSDPSPCRRRHGVSPYRLTTAPIIAHFRDPCVLFGAENGNSHKKISCALPVGGKTRRGKYIFPPAASPAEGGYGSGTPGGIDRSSGGFFVRQYFFCKCKLFSVLCRKVDAWIVCLWYDIAVTTEIRRRLLPAQPS